MASTLQQPAPLVEPFANSGDRNIIPQAATGTQKASLTEGFPPVTQLPIDRGGIPPERQDFNALGYLTTSQYFFLQNGGRFTFNPTVSAAIGGYPAGATLWYNDTARGVSYPVTSVINNNTYNFVQYPTYIDGTKWKRAIDAFPTSQVTNCITEIPQDIKLELNGGTLTLKAGSKVYVPNGFEADGVTPKFDEVISESDRTLSTFYSGTTDAMLFVSSDGGLFPRDLSTCSSGSDYNHSQTYQIWYDTTNNKVKYSEDTGATWREGYSLPIAIFHMTSGVFDRLEQVFNGFGYIGSTVFALPGIKGLVPNGRNADGTLNNLEFIVDSVQIVTLGGTYGRNIRLDADGNLTCSINPIEYYPDQNLVYINNQVNNLLRCGYAYWDSSNKITSFIFKQPFMAADYNDLLELEQRIQVVNGALPTTGIIPNRIYFVTE